MILKIFLSVFILLTSCMGWAHFPQFIPEQTHENGVGDWQELPFGHMRVLSCTTGVKDLSVVVGGLQVKLNPEWIMKKPKLTPLSEQFPSWIETPVRPGSGRNTVYQGDVFFPLVYVRDPADTIDFELGVQGDFPVCQGDKCMILPLRIKQPLSANEADYTSACAYIIEQQSQTPLMAKAQGVSGTAWVENGQIVMVFSGIKSPLIAFLQTPDQEVFQVQETQLEKTGIIMRVQTKPWTMGQEKEWILLTNKGVFRVSVKMQNSPISLASSPLPYSIWWMGWEIFFFTPLFIWWGLGISKTNKIWQKQIKKFCFYLPVIWGIRLVLGQYIHFDWDIYVVLLLGIICLFPPQRKYVALGLFLIWPFCSKIPELPAGKLILWWGIMGIEIIIPFIFLYQKTAEIGKVLRELKKKNFFLYNLIFLLPTVYLFGMSVKGIYQAEIPFKDELNKAGISIVLDKKEKNEWQKMPQASFISSDSMVGQTLQKIYDRKTPLIVWQDNWGRVILLPQSTPSDVLKFIANWNNYHALYRP